MHVALHTRVCIPTRRPWAHWLKVRRSLRSPKRHEGGTVLEVFRIHGLKVPGDATVTGYDGFGPLAAPFLGLTTFRQPVEEMGRTAMNLLLDRVEGLTNQDRLVTLRGELVAGRSAAIPRADARVSLP